MAGVPVGTAGAEFREQERGLQIFEASFSADAFPDAIARRAGYGKAKGSRHGCKRQALCIRQSQDFLVEIAGQKHRRKRSEPEVSSDFSPETRLPAVNFQLLGFPKGYGRNCGRSMNYFVCGSVFRHEIKLAVFPFAVIRQSINGQAQTWQHFVVNDVVHEYRIGVERFLVQDDAFGKCLFFANRLCPVEVRHSL
jgi:hypothetical protein